MDIFLPDGDGIELCKQLKQNPRTAGTPVILMSAHASLSGLDDKCWDSFLSKPFDIKDLTDKVRQYA